MSVNSKSVHIQEAQTIITTRAQNEMIVKKNKIRICYYTCKGRSPPAKCFMAQI